MTSKQRNNRLGVLLLTFCAALVIWGVLRRKALQENHVITTARVYSYRIGGKGNGGGVWI